MRPELDILRHIFAIFVIFQHMGSANRYSSQTVQELFSLNFWLSGAVIGFFMISGCLYKAPKGLTTFTSQHAARLLVPFFLFSIIYLIALVLLHKLSIYEGVIDTIILKGAGMQLYFLPFFLLITIVYAAGSHGVPQSKMFLFDSLLFLVLAGITVVVRRQESTGDDYHLLPLFGAGLLFGRLLAHFKNTKHFWVSSLGLIIALLLVGFYDPRFFCFAFTATLVTLGLGLKTRLPRMRLPGSGGVYLLHTPILNYAISTLLQQSGVTQWANIFLSVFLTYIVALAMTLLVIKTAPNLKWLLLE